MTTAPIPAAGEAIVTAPASPITFIAISEQHTSIQVLIQGALDRYAAGELALEQALEIIAAELALLEQQLSPIATLREQARTVLAQLMHSAGVVKAATSHAMLTLVPDTTTESFDAAKLNSLIADLVGRGLADVAAQIVATKKKGTRKGYLLVKPNRE